MFKEIQEAIVSRKLDKQIDYIIYSTNFPTQVRLTNEVMNLNHATEGSKQFTLGVNNDDYTSINMATFEYEALLNRDISFRYAEGNWYMPGWESVVRNSESTLLPGTYYGNMNENQIMYAFERGDKNFSSRGFRHNYVFNLPEALPTLEQVNLTENRRDEERGFPLTWHNQPAYFAPQKRYYLSTMLGVTKTSRDDQDFKTYNANTVDEVISYLTSAVGADATHPEATFYYVDTKDFFRGTRASPVNLSRDSFNTAKEYNLNREESVGLFHDDSSWSEYGMRYWQYVERELDAMSAADSALNVHYVHLQREVWYGEIDENTGNAKILTRGHYQAFPSTEEIEEFGPMIGLTTGTGNALEYQDYPLPDFAPGGIADNMTSYGGQLHEYYPAIRGSGHGDGHGRYDNLNKPTNGLKGSQIPITVYLRKGAAGATGTIVEPGATYMKFPGLNWPVHYSSGASLAEALYQSLQNAWQLLILGDALCQPWAKPPTVAVENLEANDKISGTLIITPIALANHLWAGSVRYYEVHIDGVMYTRYVPSTPQNDEKRIVIDTSTLTDGYHVFQIVAVDNEPNESQGVLTIPVEVDNNNVVLDFSVSTTEVSISETITLTASQSGATNIKFFQNVREIGEITGESGTVTIDASILGKGPTTIQAISYGTTSVSSTPTSITVN
jgi:hypothetical protein